MALAISHDQLGQPIRVPVLVARGRRRGPVLGLTAALHGNELNGVPVIHRVFAGLDPSTLRGTVVAVLVTNVPGFVRRQRAFMDGQDLNHIMPGRARGNSAEVYAWRLVKRVLAPLDLLVDLHTASTGRINCLYVRADMTRPDTAAMAYRVHPQVVLHNPANDRTLRGTAMGMQIPAITLEIGNPQRFHPEYIKVSVHGIRRILASHGMVPRRKAPETAHPIVCSRSRWLYTQQGGFLEVYPKVATRVEKNEVIARIRDVWGSVIQEYKAPYSGVVIGKSVDPAAETGARILHLGEIASDDDARFLRRPKEFR
ncbi:MAG: peptidase M14 [Deltaproteobacteria bacterium]|nr:MAG: peptidase M14 [Deltaproteobacteria bacterium]